MSILTTDLMDGISVINATGFQWFVRTDGNDSNSGRTNTATGAFLTIAHALSVVNPGDTVSINDGLYQFTPLHLTSQRLNFVTLASINGSSAVTLMRDDDAHYAANAGALFQITGVTGFTFTGLTLSGSTATTASSCVSLVLVNGQAIVGLVDCHLTLPQYDFELLHPVAPLPTPVAPVGFCLRVGDVTPLIGQPAGTPGRAWVVDCVCDLYQKAAIYVDGLGSHLELDGGQLVGLLAVLGPTPNVLQNGLRVTSGATATVRNSASMQIGYNGPAYGLSPGYADAWLALTAPGVVELFNCSAKLCDNGVRFLQAPAGTMADRLVVDTPTYRGIWLGSATAGAHISRARINNAGNAGLYAEIGTLNNDFQGNAVTSSATFDGQDLSLGSGTAGTANFWGGNTLGTKQPAGLQ